MASRPTSRARSDAPSSEQTVVLFGNPNPMVHVRQDDGSIVAVPAEQAAQTDRRFAPLQQSVTRVVMWDGFDDSDTVEHALSTDNDRMLSMIGRQLADSDRKYAIGVNELEQALAVHSGGVSPTWVTSSDEQFAKVLGKHFGCPVGEPKALLTTAGRDALHAQHYGTAAQPAAFNYIGITTDAAAPAAGDTVLATEETTNGLARAQATYAHTAGTNTTTLTKTYTYTGATSKVIAKIGVFNAAAAGTMGYESSLSSTATVNTSGDSLTVTETATAG